jgi:hypothetical protein
MQSKEKPSFFKYMTLGHFANSLKRIKKYFDQAIKTEVLSPLYREKGMFVHPSARKMTMKNEKCGTIYGKIALKKD